MIVTQMLKPLLQQNKHRNVLLIGLYLNGCIAQLVISLTEQSESFLILSQKPQVFKLNNNPESSTA